MSRKYPHHPEIRERFAITGCPPDPRKIAEALRWAGIPVPIEFFDSPDRFLAFFMERYKNKPEFDESFFTAQEEV
jgi:coenzyme F420-reducing hydrogenase gamma subunit